MLEDVERRTHQSNLLVAQGIMQRLVVWKDDSLFSLVEST